MNLLRHLPAAFAAAAFALSAAAAARYPGGTTWSPDTVGHRWTENFVCSLLQAKALNGEDNAARPLAYAALLLLCVGMGVLFFFVSRSTTSRVHRSVIEIGGIGLAVYSSLVATPLHNLVVNISLVLGAVAFVAVLHLMWRERRRGLFVWGVAFLGVKAANAVVYYGDVCFDLLPVLQKVGIVVGVAWLLAVHYRRASGMPLGEAAS